MRIFIACLLLLNSALIHAALYKGLDKNGNVVYSDRPFTNAKEITLPPISVVSTPKIPDTVKNTPVADEKDKAAKETKYRYLSISSPTNKQTIWNKTPRVTLTVKPRLNAKAGDYFQLLIDGKTVVQRSPNTTMQPAYIDRGEHKLQAMIRNKHGRIVKRSPTIIIYIQRTSVLLQHHKS